MSLRVKTSPGERFVNWFPTNTKLYIRGERGKNWKETSRLYYDLAVAFNKWFHASFSGEDGFPLGQGREHLLKELFESIRFDRDPGLRRIANQGLEILALTPPAEGPPAHSGAVVCLQQTRRRPQAPNKGEE